MVHRFLVSDFNLEAIFNFNFNFILKLYKIEVEVEDGLQIKIGDQKSMYHRGGCMPKVVLDFRLGTIYMVNLREPLFRFSAHYPILSPGSPTRRPCKRRASQATRTGCTMNHSTTTPRTSALPCSSCAAALVRPVIT